MEELIVNIAKELLGISIGFVGLLFTSLSILMTLKGDKKENWKIAVLKESPEYKKFINLNTNTAIGFIVLFLMSILILIFDKIEFFDTYFICFLYTYLIYLVIIVSCVGIIANKYKKIIMLMLNNKKENLSE